MSLSGDMRLSSCGTAMWQKLRCGKNCGGRVIRAAPASAIGGSGVAGLHPFDFSSRLRASRRCGQVLRSADIKAHGGDGRGDLRGGSFGRPVFAGVRGENLARSRSWAAAGLSVWRATRSRGGWPAGPVKLRRLTGPGAAGAGARSWAAPSPPELAGSAELLWGAAEAGRGGVALLAQSAKLPKRLALPAGTEVHRNAALLHVPWVV